MADKNYTKFDNDYFCHLSTFDLKGSEFRVLLFLLRQSACYKRQYTKECSYSFIANGTGLSEASVKRAIKKLISEGYIEICNQASNKKAYSYQLRVVKLGFLGGQTWMFRVVNPDHNRASSVTTKENTEDNSIEKKEKERASLDFFPCETELMKAMPESERQKYIELLPEYLRTKKPDDYSESEWDIYDEWRTSNGLI